MAESSSNTSPARTPPTPSLLSNLNPSQLLSRTRLRLISSMFTQMCDAVADCHAQNVYHRDIKPENFIVTDGWTEDDDGRRERKVVVKLTDFGLSTTDVESSDMDCGSAPYMSYECRNNIAPTYRPRAADVWSLGIVLINMLYHYNPWTDTAVGACNSFDLYRQHPVNFFMQRFAGMTRPVAELLANRVFNILDSSIDDSKRITASQFGIWARDLPDLLSDHTSAVHSTHKRVVSISSTTGHPLSSSIPVSHRPSSRQASCAIQTRPASRSHSRAPSVGHAFERPEAPELSTVIDQDLEEEPEAEEQEIILEGMTSRSTSTTKRRKRGARKGKGNAAASPTTPQDETLDTLAFASQTLAREISRASKASSKKSTSTTESSRARRATFEPVSMYAMPTAMFTNGGLGTCPPLPPLPATTRPAPVSKKPSKWKLSFGKASATSVNAAVKEQTVQSGPPVTVDVGTSTSQPSATASNVTTLIMGLSPPPPPPVPPVPASANENNTSTWGRGRRGRDSPAIPRAPAVGNLSPHASVERFDKGIGLDLERRGISPHSTRSGRPLASSASSMASSNWRNSTSTTSSAGTSTSAFTHYSNSSVRSVSSVATSISATSWRSKPGGPQPHSPNSPTPYRPPGLPKNIKVLDGVPWELSAQLPRMNQQDSSDIFGQPPPRKPRPRKPQDLKLDTITERPLASAGVKKSPTGPRLDASTSTTDLDSPDGDWQNKKVQKGQINALAKMLSALRR